MAGLGFATMGSAGAQPAPRVSPPRVLEAATVEYPASALDARRQGTVRLQVTVGIDGSVETVTITESLGEAFDAAAIAAVQRWRFAPATRDGQPVAARIGVEVGFFPPAVAGATEPEPAALGAQPAGSVARSERDEAAAKREPRVPSVAAGGDASRAPRWDLGTGVTVHGRPRPPGRGASDHHIHLGALAEVPREDAVALLQLAPGIFLASEGGGGGEAEQIYLRGFDARLGQDVEFSVDGVPVNQVGNLAGNGYADLGFLIPELVDELRVLAGPFDPRQGNFSVAGSADYHLGLGQRGLTMKGTVGSFGARRLLLTWGPGEGPLETFGGAELQRASGFGQNRGHETAKAIGQLTGELRGGGAWRVTATGYATSYQSAGVIREDDWESGRVAFYDTYDRWQGGTAQRFSLAAAAERALPQGRAGNTVYWIQQGSRARENYTGFLLDPQQELQDPHPQRGDRLERTATSYTTGARGFGRLTPRAFGRRQGLELGYAARADFVDAAEWRVQASNAIPYARTHDLGSRVANLALYADGELRPLAWLVLRGGLRGESLTYLVEDRCAAASVRFLTEGVDGDASCLSQQPLGEYREPTQRSEASGAVLLPRATVVFGPFSGFQLSVAVGRGARAIDPQYVNDATRTPFTELSAYEGGVAYAGTSDAGALVLRSVFFRTEVGQDLLFSQTAGRTTLASGSSRTGWAGSMRWTNAWLDSNSHVTLVRATFADEPLLVPYVPAVVARTDDVVHAPLPLGLAGETLEGSLAVGLSYVSPRPLPYDEWGEPLFTLDAAVGLGWRALTLGLEVTNLLDRRYRRGEFNYASDFRSQSAPTLVPARHFAAGAPRAAFLSLSLHLEGDS